MKIRFGNDKNKHVQIKMARPKRMKTCNGCRALIMNQYDNSCYLGYNQVEEKGSISRITCPKEPCPKPRTDTKMCELYRAGKRVWITNTS